MAGVAALALLFLAEFGAAVLTAVLFALLFRTRFTPVLAVGGLAVVAVAAALLTGLATGGSVLVAVGGERLQAPDLKTWADDGEVAWDSTPLLARLRDKKADREIA